MSTKAKQEIERRIKQIAREARALQEAMEVRPDWDFMIPNVLRSINTSINVVRDLTPVWKWE